MYQKKSFSYIPLLFVLTIAFAVALVLACVGCTKAPEPEENGEITFSLEAVSMDVSHVDYLSASSSPASSFATLTASVTPAYLSDCSVSWSAEWNASTSWTSGKSVPSYLSVVQNQNNPLQVTVTALQAFSVPIRVTCTAVGTNVSGTCVVGYGQRLTDGAALSRGGVSLVASSQSVMITDPFISTSAAPYDGFAENASNRYDFSLGYASLYTANIEHESVVFSVKPSAGLYSALQSSNLARSVRQHITCGSMSDVISFYAYRKAIFEALTNKSASSNNANIVSDVDAFNQAVLANQDAYDIELQAVVSTDYETAIYTYQLQFDRTNAVYSPVVPTPSGGYDVTITSYSTCTGHCKEFNVYIDSVSATPDYLVSWTDYDYSTSLVYTYGNGGFWSMIEGQGVSSLSLQNVSTIYVEATSYGESLGASGVVYLNDSEFYLDSDFTIQNGFAVIPITSNTTLCFVVEYD